ncbi:hypothetical protein L1887_31370 [Cichorium endivia]|nr:hypothetical protein L1887_31370 [Cichorium endivia]
MWDKGAEDTHTYTHLHRLCVFLQFMIRDKDIMMEKDLTRPRKIKIQRDKKKEVGIEEKKATAIATVGRVCVGKLSLLVAASGPFVLILAKEQTDSTKFHY